MKKLVLTSLLLISFVCFSQNYNHSNWWYMGSKAGIHFPNGGAPVVDLNSQMGTYEGQAVISDKNGKLLFYSNGNQTYDASHTLMPTQSAVRISGGISPFTNSVPQGVNIICDPGNCKQYYLFMHNGVGGGDSIFYCKVDMSLPGNGTTANPLGDIVASSRNQFFVRNRTEMFTAIHHANKIDWWIITTSGTQLSVNRLTAAGLNTVAAYTGNGGIAFNASMLQGSLKGSPDGSKLVMCTGNSSYLYNFNTTTGVISGAINLNNGGTGAEFSSNGQVLYLNNLNGPGYIYQYDLSLASAAIPGSKLSVGTPSFLPGLMQRGPDGKIYHSNFGGSTLGVINNPNIIGMGCNYNPAGFFMMRGSWNVPQFFEPAPIKADFNFPSPICANTVSTFTNTSLYYNKSEWWFGDPASGANDTAITQNASHTFNTPGTYTVTLIAKQSCDCEIDTIRKIITVSELPSVVLNANDVSCAGASNGSITTNIIGGSPVYNYAWSPNGGTSANATGLGVGTFSVLITDANGCTTTGNATLVSPAPLVAAINSQTNVVCYGGSTGMAAASAAGGTPLYSYSWNPTLQTTPTATGLPAGSYTLTVTDNNGCTSQTNVNILQLPQLQAFIPAQSDVSCNGGNNGSATGGALGGTNPYSYSWSNNQNTQTATGLSAGSYTMTVTDVNGCTISKTVTINESALIVPAISTQTDALCNGGSDGTATATAAGGVGPYAYSWNPSVNLNSTATSLSAGSYTCTITDSYGCTKTISVLIGEPLPLNGNSIITDASCNGGNDGSATVIPNGGTANYNYSWNTIPAQLISNATGLSATTYSCTVTDNHGCTVIVTASVGEPSAIVLNSNSVAAHCNQSDGSVSVVANGGTPGYNYSWNTIPAQLTSNASNIPAGTYSCTVTDNNGCTQIIAAVVNNLNGVTAQQVSKTSTSCFSSCDGSATAGGIGGTMPYSYQWNTATIQNVALATGLCSGVHTCTVTDDAGCKDIINVTINSPAQLIPAITNSSDVNCFGGNNGSATASANGGTPGYNYSWSTSPSQLTPVAANLTASSYTCTVTDLNGCSADIVVAINEPPQLIANISPPSFICSGQAAILTSGANGGTPGYNFSWSGGQITSSINVSPVVATNFAVTITDSKGCTAVANTMVNVNALPDVTFGSDKVSGCAPLCINFTNTTPNTRNLIWDFGDNGITSNTDPAQHCYQTSKSYNVALTVTDNNGCSNTKIINNYITVHPDPIANFSANPQPTTILDPVIHFTDLSTGAISWTWNFGDVSTSSSSMQHPSFSYADTGYYEVSLQVTNEFGCISTATKMVRINPDYTWYIPNTFTPNGDGLNDVFAPNGIGNDFENFELLVFDRWGDLIYKTNDPKKGWDGTVNQTIAQIDTYVWKVKLRTQDGRRHSYIGHVNLIR